MGRGSRQHAYAMNLLQQALARRRGSGTSWGEAPAASRHHLASEINRLRSQIPQLDPSSQESLVRRSELALEIALLRYAYNLNADVDEVRELIDQERYTMEVERLSKPDTHALNNKMLENWAVRGPAMSVAGRIAEQPQPWLEKLGIHTEGKNGHSRSPIWWHSLLICDDEEERDRVIADLAA